MFLDLQADSFRLSTSISVAFHLGCSAHAPPALTKKTDFPVKLESLDVDAQMLSALRTRHCRDLSGSERPAWRAAAWKSRALSRRPERKVPVRRHHGVAQRGCDGSVTATRSPEFGHIQDFANLFQCARGAAADRATLFFFFFLDLLIAAGARLMCPGRWRSAQSAPGESFLSSFSAGWAEYSWSSIWTSAGWGWEHRG